MRTAHRECGIVHQTRNCITNYGIKLPEDMALMAATVVASVGVSIERII